jgi:hypothetical protein
MAVEVRAGFGAQDSESSLVGGSVQIGDKIRFGVGRH